MHYWLSTVKRFARVRQPLLPLHRPTKSVQYGLFLIRSIVLSGDAAAATAYTTGARASEKMNQIHTINGQAFSTREIRPSCAVPNQARAPGPQVDHITGEAGILLNIGR